MKSKSRKKKAGSPDAEKIELRERVNALRSEISLLKEELDSYKAREREIAEALNFAKSRSEEYLKESKIRFTLESERLKAFSARWQARLKTLGDPERLGKEVVEAGRFFADAAREIEEIASGSSPAVNAPEEEYYREKIRLDELGALAEERSLREPVVNSDDSARGVAHENERDAERKDADIEVFPVKATRLKSEDEQPRLSENELMGLLAQLSRAENMG